MNEARPRMTRLQVEQLGAIRDMGVTNMFERAYVKEIAEDLGYDELVAWIDTHEGGDYARVILHGPVVEAGSESSWTP